MKHRFREEDLHVDFWPSFTDILLAVVLVLLFVLTVFVLTQTGLMSVLSAKETAMSRLSQQLTQLEEALKLSESRSQLLKGQVEGALELLGEARTNYTKTQESLTLSADEMAKTLTRLKSTEEKQQMTAQELQASTKQIDDLTRKISEYLEQVKILNTQLGSTKQELAAKETSLADLNTAIVKMNEQIARLNERLQGASAEIDAKKLELSKLITEIDRRNREIESKDKEIERLKRFELYRSEFLARLADVFKGVEDIKVVGDRFVFQGEVLFDSGKADLRTDGQQLLGRFVDIYKALAARIPADIGFNIQIQGHTDVDPIRSAAFKSNWELSTARATEVVRFLTSRGIPTTQLSAAGFSEFYPAAPGVTEAAKRQNRRIEILFTRR